MTFEKVAQNLTEEVYHRLRESLQLGKWPDGKMLSDEQKKICMEAIITYEVANDVPEYKRVGYINRDRPKPCPSEKDGDVVRTKENIDIIRITNKSASDK